MTQTIKNVNGIVKKFRAINADDNTILVYSVYNEENAETLYRLVKPHVFYQLCYTHTDAMKIKLLENTKRMYAIENINKIAHYSAKLIGRKNEYP